MITTASRSTRLGITARLQHAASPNAMAMDLSAVTVILTLPLALRFEVTRKNPDQLCGYRDLSNTSNNATKIGNFLRVLWGE